MNLNKILILVKRSLRAKMIKDVLLKRKQKLGGGVIFFYSHTHTHTHIFVLLKKIIGYGLYKYIGLKLKVEKDQKNFNLTWIIYQSKTIRGLWS